MHGKICEENPLGLEAIDHLEFTVEQLDGPILDLFYQFGFAQQAESEDKKSRLYTQGQVRFLLTCLDDEKTHPTQYLKKHGEGVCKMSFLVVDAEHALNEAKKRGATEVQALTKVETPEGTWKIAVIQGFGDVLNEFVERPKAHFRPGFIKLENDPKAKPLAQRVARIDHLTNNVPKGEMEKWVEFYQQIYGFKVTRYFDIKGLKTGLESKVVQMADGTIIIPINEPDSETSKSQIQEYLDRHQGPGVQHIALTTADIIKTVGDLQSRGIRFLDIPHTYYENISKRDFKVEEDLGILEERQLLVDGDQDGYLIQNFTDTYVGPLFFEFIQRKNHDGFGEGNFQALFDSIERDQAKRGYLK